MDEDNTYWKSDKYGLNRRREWAKDWTKEDEIDWTKEDEILDKIIKDMANLDDDPKPKKKGAATKVTASNSLSSSGHYHQNTCYVCNSSPCVCNQHVTIGGGGGGFTFTGTTSWIPSGDDLKKLREANEELSKSVTILTKLYMDLLERVDELESNTE